jgi:hypothetical protein
MNPKAQATEDQPRGHADRQDDNHELECRFPVHQGQEPVGQIEQVGWRRIVARPLPPWLERRSLLG